MDKKEDKKVKEIKKNIKDNIHALRKGQEALDQAIKTLKMLDK